MLHLTGSERFVFPIPEELGADGSRLHVAAAAHSCRRAMLTAVLSIPSLLSLGGVTINIDEGVPGRGTEHPRAVALAPGGDSGAVPTAMAIRAGAEMAIQTDVDANNFAR